MQHGLLSRAAALVLTAAVCARAFGATGGEMAVAPYDVKPLPPDAKGVFVEEGDFAHDGTTQVRIENSFIRLIVLPELGGQIGSLVLKKQGNDLTSRPTVGVPGGLLAETLSCGGATMRGEKFQYAIEKDAGHATIKMTATGKTGQVAYLTVKKSITVSADSAGISVSYEVLNDPKSGAPLTVTLNLGNMAGGPVSDTVLFFPMDPGILRFLPAKADSHDATMGEMARGWVAALDEKNGDGLAMRADYKYVNYIRTWYFRVLRPTLDWRLLPQVIEPGKSMVLHESFLPFAGLTSVNGASADVVGSMAVAGKPEANAPATVEAQFCGARAGVAHVVLIARRLPGDQYVEVEKKDLMLTPVDPAKTTFKWTPPQDGTYVLAAYVTLGSQLKDTVLSLEQPVYVGKPSAPYTMEPERGIERVSAEPIFDPKKVDLSYTSPEVVTEHVAWAKPYARGRTRAVFFLEGISSCREVVELGERFDIEPSSSLGSFVSPQYDSGTYYKKLNVSLVRAKYNELMAPGRTYDAIVLSGDTWDQLTDFSKSRIREMVWNGAGLIWIDPATKDPGALEMLPAAGRGAKAESAAWEAKADHFITRAIPFQALPPARSYEYSEVKGAVVATAGKAPLVVLGEYGHGRVALLNYVAGEAPGTDRQTHALLPREVAYPKIQYPYWEYQYGLIGRAVLWATQKEPAEQIVAAHIGDPSAISVQIASQARADAELTYSFIDQYGQLLGAGTSPVALRKGTNDLSAPLPALPNGMNVAHLVLKTPDGVSDWRALALPGHPVMVIGKVKLSKDSFDRGESVTAEADVPGTLGGPAPILEALLMDGHGRILARQQKILSGELKINFVFPLANAISTTGAMDLRLYQGGILLDRRIEKFVIRPSRTWDDFECLIWTAGPTSHESLFDVRMKIMQELGVTGIVQDPGNYVAPWLAAFLAHDLRIITKGPGKYTAAASAKYGALLNMIGDERAVSEQTSPEAIAKMRVWLKTKYADLAALNAEWGTDFKSWDDVQPMLKLDDALARNLATKTMNFAPWADYRAYLDYFFAEELRADAAALAAGDPLGRDSLSGTQVPATRTGNDWYQLSHVFKALQNYGLYRMLRSFATAEDLRLSPWIGYGGKGIRVQRGIWEGLFAGCDGTSPWCEQTNVEPDYTLFAGARDIQTAVTQIRNGPGKLLVNSPISFDPIAFHYSQDSLHGAFALGREAQLNASRDGMIAVLVALGYQPSFLSYAQIEKGELTPEKTKVFFMPHSVALSAKEAEMIRAYVNAGGVVVADVLPGVMDEHCRVLPKGQLDDVFGVTRTEIKLSDESVNLKFLASVDTSGASPPILSYTPSPSIGDSFEPSLQATTSVAAAMIGSKPAVLVNTFGKGKAIYINADLFSRYAALADSRKVGDYGARAEALERQMAGFIGAACKPRVQIVNADATPSRSNVIYEHDSGATRYVGTVSAASEVKQAATVKFGSEVFVFDLVTREAFGKVSSVKTEVGPNAVHLFALVPYEVTGIEIKSEKACARGDVFRAAVRVQVEKDLFLKEQPKLDLHVVRMEVFDPSGREAKLYTSNLLCKEGKGEAVIPFALNDAPGKWTLHFRDAATGVRAEQTVEVR